MKGEVEERERVGGRRWGGLGGEGLKVGKGVMGVMIGLGEIGGGGMEGMGEVWVG